MKFFKQKNDYHSEMTIAKQFRFERHKHEHIGKVVASFSHGNIHAMVLPWAEFDLLKYWKHNEPGPGSALWMVQQCSGIVGGLRKIHFYTSGLDSQVGSHRNPRSAHSVSEAVGATPPQPTSGRMRCAHSYRHRPPEPPQPMPLSSAAASFARSDTTHGDTVEVADRPQEMWYGRHGDIKPQNILWFASSADGRVEGEGGVSEGGILRIIDFGISEFSRTKVYGEIGNTAAYRSPESDTHRSVSSLCDIWALGCMIVEFVTWYFYGWAGVARFEKDRLSADRIFGSQRGEVQTAVFFEHIEKGPPRLKQVVVKVSTQSTQVSLLQDWRREHRANTLETNVLLPLQHIEELRFHKDCPQSIYDLLDIVTRHMLVVPIEKAKDSDTPGRANSKTLEKLFVDLLRKCNNSGDYTNTPYDREGTQRSASGGFGERVKRAGSKKARDFGGITRSKWIGEWTQRNGTDTGRTGFSFSALLSG